MISWIVMIILSLVFLGLGFVAAVLCIAGLLIITIQEAIKVVITISITAMSIAIVVGSTVAAFVISGGIK